MASFVLDTEWALPILALVVSIFIVITGWIGKRDKTDSSHETRITVLEGELKASKESLASVHRKLDRLTDHMLRNRVSRKKGEEEEDF